MADPTEKEWFSDRQCAVRFGVSRETWRRWVRIGHAPKPLRLGPGTTRWRRSDLDAFEARAEAAA